jgi:hypothetical protein
VFWRSGTSIHHRRVLVRSCIVHYGALGWMMEYVCKSGTTYTIYEGFRPWIYVWDVWNEGICFRGELYHVVWI